MRERARMKRIEGCSDEKNEADLSVAPSDDCNSVMGKGGHVNFFQQLEDGDGAASTNKENAAEKKKEQEEYEKKVGYLTYLGQDTEELTGDKVWWRKLPERHDPDQDTGPVKDVAS